MLLFRNLIALDFDGKNANDSVLATKNSSSDGAHMPVQLWRMLLCTRKEQPNHWEHKMCSESDNSCNPMTNRRLPSTDASRRSHPTEMFLTYSGIMSLCTNA